MEKFRSGILEIVGSWIRDKHPGSATLVVPTEATFLRVDSFLGYSAVSIIKG
jgi:hypothetical protein